MLCAKCGEPLSKTDTACSNCGQITAARIRSILTSGLRGADRCHRDTVLRTAREEELRQIIALGYLYEDGEESNSILRVTNKGKQQQNP